MPVDPLSQMIWLFHNKRWEMTAFSCTKCWIIRFEIDRVVKLTELSGSSIITSNDPIVIGIKGIFWNLHSEIRQAISRTMTRLRDF